MAIDLDEAERIGKALDPGLWEVKASEELPGTWNVCRDGYGIIETDCEAYARFIVYARNNWQAMVDELKAWRAMIPHARFDGESFVSQ